MTRLLCWLGRLPRPALVGLDAGLFLVLWLLDRVTGSEIGSSVFYLLPVSLAVWFLGKIWIIPTSLLGTLLWLEADIYGTLAYSHPAVPYWNAGVRLSFFLIVAALLSRLQDLRRTEQKNAKLKSEMISLVSHEFNNRLTPIWMAASLLKETEPEPENQKRGHCYELLYRNCDQLKRTVHTFLSLSRLESGRFQLSPRSAAIRLLVQEALDPLSLLTEEKKLRMCLAFPREVIPVFVDPDALLLVMSNLLVNAIKYTPDGGEIAVRIRPEGTPSRSVVVEVEDTGIGIPREDQQRIMEGFFRSEAGKKAAKGFGIGLKVSREILESHGSKLELRSEPGKGSKFFFRLPIGSDGASGERIAGFGE